MITLGTIFGTSYLAVARGGKKPAQTPPINASSPDEADFIKYDPFRAESYMLLKQ